MHGERGRVAGQRVRAQEARGIDKACRHPLTLTFSLLLGNGPSQVPSFFFLDIPSLLAHTDTPLEGLIESSEWMTG